MASKLESYFADVLKNADLPTLRQQLKIRRDREKQADNVIYVTLAIGAVLAVVCVVSVFSFHTWWRLLAFLGMVGIGAAFDTVILLLSCGGSASAAKEAKEIEQLIVKRQAEEQASQEDA